MSLRDLIPGRTRSGYGTDLELPLVGLRQELDRLFEDFAAWNGPSRLAETATFLPPVNVSENPETLRVTAELPGIDAKDVTVRLENGALVISGKKESEKEEKGRDWYRRERSHGEFRRAIQLPSEIDPNKVLATFSKGVLSVEIPKTREATAKSRVIEVKSS